MEKNEIKDMRFAWSRFNSDNKPYEAHFWFPTTIYVAENVLSEEENQQIIDRVYQIKESTPKGGENWQCNMYNTLGTYNFVNDHTFEKLISETNSHVFEFVRLLGSAEKYLPVEIWANVSEKNAFQEYHAHSLSTFSAVYYASVPENSGKIWFESPLEPDMLPVKNITNYNPLSFRNAYYTPKKGTLMIFRSYLKHMVEVNNSDSDRISIAFNY
jgi:uncharacterized protein (TIGR02466 family)